MSNEERSQAQLLAQNQELARSLQVANQEKADLEILLETVTEHATSLENQILESNHQMAGYIKQVEKLTDAAVAVEQNTFDLRTLDDIATRPDELGTLARVFQQMVITVKAREEELAIAEENYRGIYENALEGMFQALPNGTFLSVNPAMAKIYGYHSPNEMVSSITDIVEQLYVDPQCAEIFRQTLATAGQIKSFEYRSYRKDGTQIWVEEDTRAVHDSDGNLLYYEGIIQDITERKHQEAELKRQLEVLRIEIDQKKRQQEVAQITESSYFQELQSEVSEINLDEFWS
jgi:PAS domain S-box-containing protein